MDNVILVDERDVETGIMEKLEAHQRNMLHRAFSVFIFDNQGRMLLQQRALSKYHSPGLWTNACCSHPRPGENTLRAAENRLQLEMGIDTELYYKTSYLYKADVGNGLFEHEFDHIFTGHYSHDPAPNPDEACSFKWLETESIKKLIEQEPQRFTVWFRLLMRDVF